MYNDQAIIFKKGAVESYETLNLNNIFQGSTTFDFVVGNYLIIGSDFPINTRFIKVKTANTLPSNMVVETYGGMQWDEVDILIDETKDTGVSLAQSGLVTWVPKKFSVQDCVDSDQLIVDGVALSTIGISAKFWTRIRFDADLDPLTELDYVGYKFSNESILYSFYPDLDNQQIRNLFVLNKADWEKETIIASIELVRDLVNKGVTLNGQQLLDWSIFDIAASHKTASIIYGAMRGGSINDKNEAINSYHLSLENRFYKKELSNTGKLDRIDAYNETTWFTR